MEPSREDQTHEASFSQRLVAAGVGCVLSFNGYWIAQQWAPGFEGSTSFLLSVPIAAGVLAGLIVGWKSEQPIQVPIATAFLAGVLGVIALTVCFWDVAAYVAIGAPIVLAATTFGGCLGHGILMLRWRQRRA